MFAKRFFTISFMMLFIFVSCAKKNPIVSGTFEGSGEGRNGDITVSVVLEDSVIKGIDVLSSEETDSIASPVFTDMLQTMIDNNNVNVDSVSGATMTSEGFTQAVVEALAKAGVNLKGKKIAITKGVKEEPIQNYDVIVIGGGGAGFSAAIEAKNNGADRVVLLEKLRSVGGSTLISGAGVNAADTWMQKKFGIKDSEELFYQDSLKGGDNLGTPELIRYVTANADEAVIWLSNYIGVPYRTYVQQFGGHSVPRSHNPEGHSGEGMISLMNKKASELGIDVKTGTEALSLLMSEDGRVNGVTAKRNGQSITFNADKAVIIATGGFGANVEMRQKYNAEYDENYLTTVSSGNTGDGIRMAEKIGADTIGMEYIQTYPTANPITGVISYVANTRFNGAILVGKEGKRFVDEMGRRDNISKAILTQTDRVGYLVWDEAIGKVGEVMEGNKKEYDALVKQNLIVKADTIEDAAKFFDISAEELKNTIAKVNGYAETQKDLDFNRKRPVAITEGPFYIQKVVPSIHHTMGGLKIDVNAHVLDKNGNPIPGLYAAGEVTGGIHGSNRLGGNAIADIVVFGRLAGKNAATGI